MVASTLSGISPKQKPRPEYVDELQMQYEPHPELQYVDDELVAVGDDEWTVLNQRLSRPAPPTPVVLPDEVDIASVGPELDAALSSLTTDQLKYIEARIRLGTDQAVSLEWGKKGPNSMYQWKRSREPKLLKKIINWLQLEKTAAAEEVLRRHLLKAVNVKTGGLDSVDERLRQAAATEILDRTMGKPMQRVEQKTQAEVLTVVVDF